MIIKLTEESWQRYAIERIQEKVNKKYTFYCNNELCIDYENLMELLLDLEEEYDSKCEKIEELESENRMIIECSKPIDPYTFYGVSEEDFY